MLYIWIIDLDEYFLLKKNSRIQRTVYYALPRYEADSKKQYVIPENESFEQYYLKPIIFLTNTTILNKFFIS